MIHQHEQVRWIGCVVPPRSSDVIPLANRSNTHEYKPVFVRAGSELHCYVTGPDVRDQVQAAWSLLDYGILETIQDDSGRAIDRARVAIMAGLNALERLPPNLFIGRLGSFVMATRLAQWLREGRLSLTQARARLVHHEIVSVTLAHMLINVSDWMIATAWAPT
jgi:hypothetical protein